MTKSCLKRQNGIYKHNVVRSLVIDLGEQGILWLQMNQHLILSLVINVVTNSDYQNS